MAQKKKTHKKAECGSMKAENASSSMVSEDTVLRKCIFSFVAGAFFIGCISVLFDLARYKMREGEFPEFRAFLVGEPVGRHENAADEGQKDKASDEISPDAVVKNENQREGNAQNANGASACAVDAQTKQDAAFDKVQPPLVEALSICGLNGIVGVVFDVDKAGSVRVLDVTGEGLEKNDVACVSQYVKEQKYPLDAICADAAHVSWSLDLSVGGKKGVKNDTSVVASASKRVATAEAKSAVEPKPAPDNKQTVTKQPATKTARDIAEQGRTAAQPVSVEKKIVFVDTPKQENAALSSQDSQIVVKKQDNVQKPSDVAVESAMDALKAETPSAVPTVSRDSVISTVKSMMEAKLALASLECNADGTLKGTVVLRNDGSLTNIRTASGTLKGTEAEGCIVGKLKGISGSAFSGGQEVIPWKYPVE